MGSEVRGLFKSNVPAGSATEGLESGSDDVAAPTVAASDAQSAPMEKDMGTLFSVVCSNVPTYPASPLLSSIVDYVPPSLTPAASGPISKKKTTMKKFSTKSRPSLGSKQSVAGFCRRLDADLGTAAAASVGAMSSPVARSAWLRSPVSTACKIRMVQDSGEPVPDQAARLAAAKDVVHLGTPPIPSHVRLVLPVLPDSHLVKVLSDVGVSFDSNFGSPSTLLSLV